MPPKAWLIRESEESQATQTHYCHPLYLSKEGTYWIICIQYNKIYIRDSLSVSSLWEASNPGSFSLHRSPVNPDWQLNKHEYIMYQDGDHTALYEKWIIERWCRKEQTGGDTWAKKV